jgi:hypothetical protein
VNIPSHFLATQRNDIIVLHFHPPILNGNQNPASTSMNTGALDGKSFCYLNSSKENWGPKATSGSEWPFRGESRREQMINKALYGWGEFRVKTDLCQEKII